MEFKNWFAKVDAIMAAHYGLGAGDLPDWNYRDAFDEGMEPTDAARHAIAEILEAEGYGDLYDTILD